jgi:hypothetical protein
MMWHDYFKLDENGVECKTNLIYSPKVNDEGDRYMMSFNHRDPYQAEIQREDFTKELVEFFWNREKKYLEVFKDRSWAPRLINIVEDKRFITFDFPGESCNHIIYSGRRLEDYCPDWKQQLYDIIRDIQDSGYYKVSLYPHCFYIEAGTLRTLDFYGCVENYHPYVDIANIKGMIGEKSTHRFESATEGDRLNIETLYMEALEKYIEWPNDALKNIYRRLY